MLTLYDAAMMSIINAYFWDVFKGITMVNAFVFSVIPQIKSARAYKIHSCSKQVYF